MFEFDKTKWKLTVIFFTSIAVLYELEVSSNHWIVKKSIKLKVKLDDAVNFITATDYTSKWFPFASSIREADSRPLDINKKYYAIYDIPLWGEMKALYKVVEYQPLSKIVLESEGLLRPRLEFAFNQLEKDESRLSVTITYNRMSYLYQYLVGPILYFLTNQRLQHALFVLKMMTPY